MVKECRYENKLDGKPLIESLQLKLQDLVGESHWYRAEKYLCLYMIMKKNTAPNWRQGEPKESLKYKV